MSLIRNRVISRAVSQDVNIDDKAIKDTTMHTLTSTLTKEYSLQHIFISGQRQDAAARARLAFGSARKGEIFWRRGQGVLRRAFKRGVSSLPRRRISYPS